MCGANLGAYLHPHEQTIDLKEVPLHPKGEVLAYALSPVTGDYPKTYMHGVIGGTLCVACDHRWRAPLEMSSTTL